MVRADGKISNNIKYIAINKVLCGRMQGYECKKCGSIYPIDSFDDKPQNITCLACYLSEKTECI